jgi:predicted HicB family RNase H-like nuclease
MTRKIPRAFPLRLPMSTHQKATDLAESDGISLNQFIALAVVEKIARLDVRRVPKPDALGSQ